MLKRKLAALLAGAMVLTSLPMVSFAASDNRVTKVPTIKKDTILYWDVDGDGYVPGNGYVAPELRVEKKHESIAGTFRLTFENAEWKGEEAEDDVIDDADVSTSTFTYKQLTKNVVEFTITDADVNIPLAVKVTGAGEAKVTVDPLDTNISAGTYVFANAGDGATKTTIADTSDFPDELELATIMIDELKAKTLPINEMKKIELKAPAGFVWAKKAGVADKVTLDNGGGFGTINAYPTDHPTYGTPPEDDEEVLQIFYTIPTASSSDKRGSILLKDLKLVATEDADLGEVEVEVSGDDITTEKIKVGSYVEYGVKVTAEDEDLPELFSGRYAANDDDAHKLLKLTIEEGVVDSWWDNRKTTIEFEKGIKVRRVEVDDADGLVDNTGAEDDEITLANKDDGILSLNKDNDIITLSNLNIDSDNDKKGKVVLKIWVSIEADYEGDIVATVGGPALPDETEVTLAKAVIPVSAAFETNEVKIGYKEVAVSDIEIIEAKAGALERGKQLIVKPENDYMEFDDDFDFDVEVTSGDLQIGDVDLNSQGQIVIDIKRASKEASTIKITGAGVYLDRSLAEGSFDLEVLGQAFLQNSGNNGDEFNADLLAFEDFIKVVTPAPDKGEASGAAVTASFSVGSSDYTVGDNVATADAAPYVKDGRTMIPVKYAAYALGVDPQNVKWDQATKTVTILGDRVIQVKIGSKDLVVNGAVLTMDTAAEVVDGRTFLPISWVASALNVPYTWDDATKTVTFN